MLATVYARGRVCVCFERKGGRVLDAVGVAQEHVVSVLPFYCYFSREKVRITYSLCSFLFVVFDVCVTILI